MKEQLQLDKQLCFRLYTAARLITQAYYPLLKEIGLTYPQYLVMMVLWEKDKQRVNDSAKRLYLETSTVTPLLKRMETEGLITRGKSGEDGREVIVSLTAKGRSMESKAACIPSQMGDMVVCRSITPESAPAIFATLDDLIRTLASKTKPD